MAYIDIIATLLYNLLYRQGWCDSHYAGKKVLI